MKKNSPVWISAILLIFVLVIFNAVMSIRISENKEKLDDINASKSASIEFEGKSETGEECPDAEGGLEDSFLQVKYFYSRFCPWCAKEEPILQRLVKSHGNLIHIEWYNVDTCSEITDEYKISGVPTLVFSSLGNQTEYSHYGFTYEKDLIKLVCDVTGGC